MSSASDAGDARGAASPGQGSPPASLPPASLAPSGSTPAGASPAAPTPAPAGSPIPTEEAAGAPTRPLAWMEQLVGPGGLRPPADAQAAYQRLLDQLQTSANLLNNEVPLQVAWADAGTTNQLGTRREVRLQPDDLLAADGTPHHGRLAALTGRVYLASVLAATVHPEAWYEAGLLRRKPARAPELGWQLWQALELREARRALLQQWPGFDPTLQAEVHDGRTAPHHVQAWLDAAQPDARAASVAVAWNLLHPAEQLRVPATMHAVVAEATAVLEEEVERHERAQLALRAASVLCRLPHGTDTPTHEPRTHDDSLFGAPMAVATQGLAQQVPSTRAGSGIPTPTHAEGAEEGATPGGTGSDEGAGRDVELVLESAAGAGLEAAYAEAVRACTPAIRQVVGSLLFNNTEASSDTYGHLRGELDEASLYKLGMRDERIMQRRDVVERASIGVGLLIDESGSMVRHGRMELARDVAITLYEACRQVRGISISVHGHSTRDHPHTGVERVLLREYVAPGTAGEPSSMMSMEAGHNNLDSWAILHLSRILQRAWAGHARRLLFVISDGVPSGEGYGGAAAEAHMRQVCDACRAGGVEVYGIGIDSAYSVATGAAMYGERRSVVLEDVRSSAQVIGRFLRQVTRSLRAGPRAG